MRMLIKHIDVADLVFILAGGFFGVWNRAS
jgi:hypothetical protein